MPATAETTTGHSGLILLAPANPPQTIDPASPTVLLALLGAALLALEAWAYRKGWAA